MRLDSPAADRVTALVLFLLGGAATYGGFVMDRLENRQIHPASIPGLVPMILGVMLMVCAAALAWSATRPREGNGAAETVSWSRFGVTLFWCALYALAAVGQLPFAPATAIFIAGFTLWFIWTESDRAARPGLATVLAVLAFSGATAFGVAALFRYGFLVRLP
jgi:putative tricarboxylic transport membrane protein